MSPVVHNKTNPQTRSKESEQAAANTVVICGEDGLDLIGVCDGPDELGRCPFAGVDGLPCNGSWIVVGGWTLKVAEEAVGCPVAMLGLSARDAA
jgi:hypothetical protein